MSTKQDKKSREKWIDCVKCIAILIVMLNHTEWTIPGVNFWGGMFFVPVFFVVSGFTYYEKDESFLQFVKRKAKRLLLPYIVANGILFIFFLLKDVLMGVKTIGDMLPGFGGIFYSRNQILLSKATQVTLLGIGGKENLYLMTMLNSPTWFLTALFLTMVVFELLTRLCKGDYKKILLIEVILLLVANIYHYIMPLLLPWSLDAIPYFLILFMWGKFVQEKKVLDFFDKRKGILLVVAVVFVATALLNGSANFSIADYGRSITLAVFNGAVSSTLIMFLCHKGDRYIPGFTVIMGQHTLLLLCYHLFLFEIFKTVWPEIHPAVNIVLTTILLVGAGVGKEKFLHGKKSRH